MSTGEHRLALPAGYELGKYRFREILGSGGFGITYLAEDRTLNRRVAIKELLPNDIATRVDGTTVAAKTVSEEENLAWARERFVNEGRALAACDHPNVVHVYEMIEANGTAYMVTKYEEGQSLEQWLKELGRKPTEEELRGILMPLLSGLQKVHEAGFLHRDIKPDNIYITKSGRPVLLDFGSARQAVSNRSMAMTSIVTSGYAPFEQYYEDGNQGPWSDIYALGAVMYRAIVGKKPPESTRRLKDDPCEKLAARYFSEYSAEFLKAVDKALSVNESRRPQDVAEWRVMLGDDLHEAATLVRKKEVRKNPQGWDLVQEMMRQRPWIAPAAGGTVIVLAILVWLSTRPPVDSKDHSGKKRDDVVVNSPTPAPTTIAPLPTSTPLLKNADDTTPTPAPTAVVMLPTPTAAPEIPVVVTPTPVASPVASQVDVQLIGAWQSGSTKSTRTRWDIWADGHWVATGAINDSGTLTAVDGRIVQFSNTTQQQADVSYEFDNGALITHGQLGTVQWHKVYNNSNTSTTPKKKSSDYSRPRSNNGNNEGPGRQILNRFMQNHGF